MLADIFGTLMGDHFHSKIKGRLLVGAWTTLIVVVRTAPHFAARVDYLEHKVENINKTLPELGGLIGNIVIKRFEGDSELESLLNENIDLALERSKTFNK